MVSYCCFWKRRRSRNMLPVQIIEHCESISFQDMLGLLDRPDVGVVVIEGIGGSGKTWAAKAVYQSARTSNIFDEYIWVSLSAKCSMRHCVDKIAVCLLGNIRDNLSVETTKTMTKEYLTRRKFLLVLDNAYFTEENILEHLGVPHPQQQSIGSKIFVTTRTRRTERVMMPNVVLTPQPLTYEESYDLLREKIGKDISFAHDVISKCYGIPLIIIILGGILCNATRQDAFSELVTNAYAALEPQISVFNTMQRLVKFGYHQLPSNITRQCFLYCLLFPEDQGIPDKELTLYWIMDGLFPEASGFHEANHIGKEILDVLIKHGMIYLEDNDCVRTHDVVRETLSRFGKDDGYIEQHNWYFDNPIMELERRAKLSSRISLMYTELESLQGRPQCMFVSSLLLRGNYYLKAISEDFFSYMGTLGILDLSFTKIKVLPSSISCLAMLRMLLLIRCDLLEEIQHIGSLVQLEVLNASGCSSLRSIDSGSFDRMVLLKVLDLSETSITMLTSIPAFMELRHLHLQGCAFVQSEFPYGVSKSGAVINLQLGSIENLAYWMDMLLLPCGLTFQLSDRSGMQVSFDVNGDGKTYVYANDAHFFNCLEKDSSLWFNCFQKFQIVISPLMDDQTTDIDAEVIKTDSIFQNSYFRTKYFPHSIDPERYLELNGIIGIPSDLDGILCHAEVISLKRLTITAEFSDLNLRSMEAVRELWVENCNQLETLLSAGEVQALSARGNLHKLWISNTENLLSFCKGVKDMTSFSCLKHLLLDCCPNLKCVFPAALRFPNLETLHIKFCDILERVFDSPARGEDSLPRLQLLQLWELHELTSVCSGVLPSLKNLKVRGCAKLQRIPVGMNENIPLLVTNGEESWWDSLIWDDESIKLWVLFRKWGPLLPHHATEG